MKYNEVVMSLVNNLAKRFDNIYHGAELVVIDGVKMPVVSIGDEWLPLDITDQKEIIYIRRAGDDIMIEEKIVSACTAAYKMRTPLRIVFFQDYAKSHEEILSRLMKSSLLPFTKLRAITRDKFKLEKEESGLTHPLGASTAYMAIDIDVIWHLLPDTCEEDFCIVTDNPIKKCSTDIVNS